MFPSEKVEPYMGLDELRSSVCQVHGVIKEKIVFKTIPNISVSEVDSDIELTEGDQGRERIRS